MREVDMEDLARKFDSCMQKTFDIPTNEDIPKYEPILKRILTRDNMYHDQKILRSLLREHKCIVKNSFLFQVFLMCKRQTLYSKDDEAYIRKVLQIKGVKSHSGINSITVFTSGHPEWIDTMTKEVKKQEFSCKWNCSFCPTEPGQPKSYLSLEPGVLRANRNHFDCVSQMLDRLKGLYLCGHDCDKLEVLVLGGTWCSYPFEYREQFIRDIYYAANVFFDVFNERAEGNRERLSLDSEKSINKNALCRVIGLTLETRPDTITAKELKLLRYYGCTRVQLGIQHIDNAVLKKVNRMCKTETTIKAIKLLKDCGYKIDGHFMPNLPGSTLDNDTEMFHQLLGGSYKNEKGSLDLLHNCRHQVYDLVNSDLQIDQWKVYPCTVVPYTEIEEWFRSGEYVPYDRESMKTMLLDMKANMLPWIRLNRIVRDIPDHYSMDSEYHSNMRQDLLSELKKQGRVCKCLRCREVKKAEFDNDDCQLVIREYNASCGVEYFISFESKDTMTLYGFLRLRLTHNQPIHIFPELEGCGLIRELHVYGKLHSVGQESTHVQHKGLGRHLVNTAESIARQQNFKRMSVIAGEGTRGYYEKLQYNDDSGEGRFMMKEL
jgi:ELP3 family radical SAM enzyme/protein acetyltransferase